MKTFILDVYDVQLTIRNALQAHLGAEALVTDITDILIACFEVSLYGHTRTIPMCPSQQLLRLGLAPSAATRVTEAGCYYFQVLLTKSDGMFDTSKVYSYRHLGVSDFVIQEKQMPEPDPYDRAIAQLREEVYIGMSNGDWYSERIRQLIGLQ
jgi:hypothetical protein